MTVYITVSVAAKGYWLWPNGICCKFTIDPFEDVVQIHPISHTDG